MRLIDYKDFDYLFDDLFYMYFEDEDLMNRFNKLKLQVCLVPSAGFHHYHSHVQNIVRDDLKMQIVKRVSSHIFSFKSSYKNVLSQLPGWLLLELRICLSNFILLNWRNSIVEVLSVVKFFPFLFRVHKRKLNEKIIFQNLL
jgi:GT2 family glycosyltransferase